GFHTVFPVSSASMIIFSSQTICQAICCAVRDLGSGRYSDPSGMRASTLRVVVVSLVQNVMKSDCSSTKPSLSRFTIKALSPLRPPGTRKSLLVLVSLVPFVLTVRITDHASAAHVVRRREEDWASAAGCRRGDDVRKAGAQGARQDDRLHGVAQIRGARVTRGAHGLRRSRRVDRGRSTHVLRQAALRELPGRPGAFGADRTGGVARPAAERLADRYRRRAEAAPARRLGRCFTDTERMTNSRRPLARSGVRACTIAAAINLSTAGRLSTLADSRRMKRVWRPDEA